tara:strand:+ start:171 stop:845 length:675 start_codon:yes stop_codon:yes gene_type:complete
MSKKTRSVLKSYFQVGDQPSEAQFIDVFDSTANLSESNALTGSLTISGSAVNLSVQGHITSSGNISASGDIIGSDYTLDGVALTTTFTELNYLDGITPAQGVYVKAMNQSVVSTAATTFAGLTLTKVDYETLDLGSATIKVIDGGSAGQLLVRSVPSIGAGASSATYTLTTNRILATSIIMISTSALITCNATNIAAGACKITFHNPTLTDFNSANVAINIVII